jgi:hypothetical protein
VHFRRRGKLYSRRFYDQKHGGSRKALAAAIAWRDRSIARSAVLTLREFHQQKRSNNTSGVPGVHFLRPARQPRSIWQARIRLANGQKIHKTFSVNKYGKQRAFEKAVAARGQLLRLINDGPFLQHPLAKRAVPASSTIYLGS